VCSRDPERYSDGSIAISMATNAGKDEGKEPGQE
jgi:hypothetical protein